MALPFTLATISSAALACDMPVPSINSTQKADIRFVFFSIAIMVSNLSKTLQIEGGKARRIASIFTTINQLSSVRARIMAPIKEMAIAGVQAATDIGTCKDDPKICMK